jgi:TolB-like protein/DNA-binding winged helix-turn-helix (wHTH) protein/tetratricopeptide (TPR) repeat protein
LDVSLRDRGVFAFGPFQLDPTRRTLRRDGQDVPLTARLFETLLYMVQNADRLVTREELETALWRGRAVEAGNLQKAISSLRGALRDAGGDEGCIVTIAGRGFRFAVPVSFEPEPIEPFVPVSAGPSPLDSAPHPARPWWIWGVALPCAAMVAGAAVWYAADRPARFAPPPHSIAVMAFTNLSGDPRQDYFSDGVSEELIDQLSRIGAVQVAARQSAFSFKGKPATIADISRQLNVGTVLEGSIRRDGPRVRATVHLVDAATGYQIWSRSFDSGQGDILKIQEEIADAVTTSLKVMLLGNEPARGTYGETTNPKAYDIYLRGLAIQRASNEMGNHNAEALAAFDQAIALDPGFALALVARAYDLESIADVSTTADRTKIRALQAEAMDAANRAIALAPQLGRAHAARGYILSDQFDFAGASTEYGRAVDLSPGDASILLEYGEYQMALGHSARGLAAATQPAALDPLSPEIYRRLGWLFWCVREYDNALGALRRGQQVGQADTPQPMGEKGFIELSKGDPAAALRDCSGQGDAVQTFCLAMALHAVGKPTDAMAQVAKVRATFGDNAAYDLTQIYAQWGDIAEALHWLGIAYTVQDPGLKYLKVDPMLDAIRDTPEYRDVVRRMGL